MRLIGRVPPSDGFVVVVSIGMSLRHHEIPPPEPGAGSGCSTQSAKLPCQQAEFTAIIAFQSSADVQRWRVNDACGLCCPID